MSSTRELRFAFTFEDVDKAVRVFRGVFGLEVKEEFAHEGARGFIFNVPAATLEVFDTGYARHVDEIEVGRSLGANPRVAVRIDNLTEAAGAVGSVGIAPESEPVETPWGDHNQRFKLDENLQLTLFEPRSPRRRMEP